MVVTPTLTVKVFAIPTKVEIATLTPFLAGSVYLDVYIFMIKGRHFFPPVGREMMISRPTFSSEIFQRLLKIS